MRQERKQMPTAQDPLDIHKPKPLENGEYVCECGWVMDWHGPSGDEQIAAHHAEVERIAEMDDFEQLRFHIREAMKPRGFVDTRPDLTIARRLTDWGYRKA